jgi:hypothetical protein
MSKSSLAFVTAAAVLFIAYAAGAVSLHLNPHSSNPPVIGPLPSQATVSDGVASALFAIGAVEQGIEDQRARCMNLDGHHSMFARLVQCTPVD